MNPWTQITIIPKVSQLHKYYFYDMLRQKCLLLVQDHLILNDMNSISKSLISKHLLVLLLSQVSSLNESFVLTYKKNCSIFWFTLISHTGNWTWTSQVLQICKEQLDWAPAEMPAKIAGLGTSRNKPSKIAGWGTSRYTHVKFAGLGTSRNHSIWVIGKKQASGLLFSGELLETGGIYDLTPTINS